MPVVIQSSGGPLRVEAAAFVDESELEGALATTPSLLEDESDAPLALVQRQVNLDAGLLDILLVDANGLPVAVEVKLARNGETRRQIVAQIVDYVESLTRLTVDELNGLVEGALEVSLRSFDTEDGDESRFDQRWQSVGANLRAGLARIVLALDEAPDDLLRIVRFLAAHSDFPIRLAVVSKYPDPRLGTMYVPRILLSGEGESGRQRSEPKPVRAELGAVVAAYDSIAAPELRTFGRAPHYRLVRPADWPAALRIHYEFMQTGDTVRAELHLEGDAVSPLGARLMSFAGAVVGPGRTALEWDPKWSSGRGRLRAVYALSHDPKEVAAAMIDLIRLTRADVTAALKANADRTLSSG